MPLAEFESLYDCDCVAVCVLLALLDDELLAVDVALALLDDDCVDVCVLLPLLDDELLAVCVALALLDDD